VAWISAPVSPC